MNKQLRQFEKDSGLEIYGLGARREKWERALEKYAELIIKECIQVCADRGTHHDGLYSAWAVDCSERIEKHFAVEESKGWVCPKCSADRTKIACPLGFGATIDGRCPMTAEAQ